MIRLYRSVLFSIFLCLIFAGCSGTNITNNPLSDTKNEPVIESTENPVVADSSNIFDPETVKRGDIIAGMTVLNAKCVYFGSDLVSYLISFEGEFTVTGNLVIDLAGSGAYRIWYDDEQMGKLPYDPNRGNPYMEFTNEEAFKAAAGDMLNKITGENPSLPIKVQLSNFTYKYNNKGGMANTAQFVKIIN